MYKMAVDCEYEYMNEESINQYLICTICSKPFVDPVITKCKGKKHRFCRYCIEQHLKCNCHCPKCHQNLNDEDLTSITDGILIEMLDEILIKCVSCNQTNLERGNFAAHKNEICAKAVIECPSSDIMCVWTGTRDKLEKHLKICVFNSLKPLIIQLQNSCHQLNDQVKQQKTRIGELIKVNKQVNSRVKQQKIQIEELTRDNTNLNDKVDIQQTAIEGFIEDNKNLHDKVDIQQFQELINKVNQQQTDVKIVQDENQRLKHQIEQLKKQTSKEENQPNYRSNDGMSWIRNAGHPNVAPPAYSHHEHPHLRSPSTTNFPASPIMPPTTHYPPSLDLSGNPPPAQTVVPPVIVPIPIFIPVNWNINTGVNNNVPTPANNADISNVPVPVNNTGVNNNVPTPANNADISNVPVPVNNTGVNNNVPTPANNADISNVPVPVNNTGVNNIPSGLNDVDNYSNNDCNDDIDNIASSVHSADSDLSSATSVERFIRPRNYDFNEDDLYN